MPDPTRGEEPAPVPPPVDALLKLVAQYGQHTNEEAKGEEDAGYFASGTYRRIEIGVEALYAAGVEEGRRQTEQGVTEAAVRLAAKLDSDEYRRTEEMRGVALSEAYWRLREHALGLRSGFVYTNAQERAREAAEASREGMATGSDGRWREKALGLRSYARGVDGAARHIAEMLGVEEHEIERPAVDHG